MACELNGVPGSQITISCEFRDTINGQYIDDQDYVASNELPRIQILDPDDAVIYDTDVSGHNNPPDGIMTRLGVGRYQFVYKIPAGAEITIDDNSRTFKAKWFYTVANVESTVINEFDTSSTFKTSCNNTDQRIGFMFSNPDCTSNHYYPGWGRLITPDEIRSGLFFGNQMAAQNGDFYTDSMIQWYVDNALRLVELDLNIRITPINVRHRPFPYINENTGQQNSRDDFDPASEDFKYEDPYDYRQIEFSKFIYVPLRLRPLLKITKARMVDPLGGSIYDLLPWARPNHQEGTVEFYPNTTLIGTFPFFSLGSQPFQVYPRTTDKFPDAFLIDYVAGYENAKKVPQELRQVVFNVAAWNLLNDVGDGRSAALASSSIGLAGISESFATTQSATSALYGARLESIQKWLKQFYERNRFNYSGIQFIGV